MTAVPAPRTAPITQLVGGHAHHSAFPDETFDVLVLLMYHSDNPYSVPMDITVHTGYSSQTARWEVAREMIHTAAVWGTPSGIGDFRTSAPSAELVQFQLLDPLNCSHTEEHHFDMHLPRRQVQAFIMRTLRAVPAGSESAYLNLDGELERLFA